uniref:S100 calcium binding protein A10b n=1 Tax=Gasterosteus aculeatus aculeatus TaxID=481459 RepID=A0AAQ4SA75_GASAC|nr:protein S100-A10b [Gasterosteus aculeatus aculeatus]
MNSQCVTAIFTQSPTTVCLSETCASTTMTELEKCMESLITIFHRYADADGDGKSLSKKELNKLVETELPTFLKSQKNPKVVEQIRKDLDQNGDDKVDFEEFLSLIVGLSIACEKCFMLHEQKKGKK